MFSLVAHLWIGTAGAAEQGASGSHDPYGALELVFSRSGADAHAAPVAKRIDPWALADMFIAPSAVPPNLASSFDRTAWSTVNGFVKPLVPTTREATSQKPVWHGGGHTDPQVRAVQREWSPARKVGSNEPAIVRYRRVSTKPRPRDESGPKWVPLPSILKPTSALKF